MLCLRIIPRSLSHIHRVVTTDVRSYRFTPQYISSNVTKKTWLPAAFPLTRGSYTFFCSSRGYCTKSSETESQQEPETDPQTSPPEPGSADSVRTVYRYPHIKTARTISKVKIFQTLFVTGAVPYVYAGYVDGVVAYTTLMSSVGIMTIATLMLYFISDLISKIICIMKYNKVTGQVFISHINFWGRRRDVTLDLSNIIPISDSTENITDTFIKVNTYDKSETFLIFIKNCSEEEKKEVLRIIG